MTLHCQNLTLNRRMSDSVSECDLVSRMAAGDEDALRILYDSYAQRLYAFAVRITGDPTLAEDVLQDSLVAAWQGASRFRGESRLVTWLLGIVHHKALNSLRGRPAPLPLEGPRQVGDGISSQNDQDHELISPEPLPEQRIARHENRRLIRQGLEDLSPEHRAILELVFYQGLSLAEAAEVCRVPLGTVKSRLSYAKNSLRGALSRAGIGPEDIE